MSPGKRYLLSMGMDLCAPLPRQIIEEILDCVMSSNLELRADSRVAEFREHALRQGLTPPAGKESWRFGVGRRNGPQRGQRFTFDLHPDLSIDVAIDVRFGPLADEVAALERRLALLADRWGVPRAAAVPSAALVLIAGPRSRPSSLAEAGLLA